VAVTHNGTDTMRAFVDGRFEGMDVNVNVLDVNSDIWLGARQGTADEFKGDLREVRVWNRELSDEQITLASVGVLRMQYARRLAPRAAFATPEDFQYERPVNMGKCEVNGSFTMCARIRVNGPDKTQGGRILAKRDGMQGWEFVAPRCNGLVSFFGGGKHVNLGTTRVDDGEWHHVAVTHNGTDTMRAFVDGRFEGMDVNVNVFDVNSDLWLGARQGTADEFKGDFKEDGVWNRELSDEQITRLAAVENAAKPAAAAPKPTPMMKIVLRTEHELEVDGTHTVSDMKDLIHERLGHEPDCQTLVNGKIPMQESSATLGSFGIDDGSCVTLLTRSPLRNVALGKPAFQSSDYVGSKDVGKPEHNGLRPASNAVDGDNLDENGGQVHCVSHTKSDHQAWWRVDLGASHTIEKIIIYTRSGCIERLWPCVLLVSDTPLATDLLSAIDQASNSKRLTIAEEPQRVTTIDVCWSGRYVQIQLEGKNNLQLAQVEVYSRDALEWVHGIRYLRLGT